MTLNEFRTLDRRGRKRVLHEMHLERMALEKLRTPEEMEPFLIKLRAWEDEHEEAKSPGYMPPKPALPPTSWAVLLED